MHICPSGSSVYPLPHPHLPFDLCRGVHFVGRELTDLLVRPDPEPDDFVYVCLVLVLVCVCPFPLLLGVDVPTVISPADVIE